MTALVGALRVSLSADTAKFHTGMKGAEAQARRSGSSINKSLGLIKAGFAGLAAGLSVGLITQAIRAALDYAGSLGETAQQLGVTTKELQLFRFAVQQNGGTLEDADKSLGKLTLSMSKALSGSKQSAAAFNAVGVSLEELRSNSKTEILGKIADGMKAAGGASVNAAAGVAIFGKGFQKIVPVLDQGSAGMNELARAAEELGIVLSDEQIRRADETADKLDALRTVLSARIAGVVADNANAILGLADALLSIVTAAGRALNAWRQFAAEFNASVFENMGNEIEAAKARGSNFKSGEVEVRGKKIKFIGGTGTPSVKGSTVTVKLAPAKPFTPPRTGSPSQFLAPKGGGGKKAPKAPKDTSLRDAFQFDEELRRTRQDVLRAQQDLAADYVARNIIAIQILDLEKESFDAELAYRVAAKELTAAQAEKLKANNDIADGLKRQAVLEDEQAERREEYFALERTIMEIELDKLHSEEQLAETAEEQRAIRLRIVDAQYRMERAILEAVLADEKSSELAKNQARQRLAALNAMQKNDQQGVIQGTRGPWEEFANAATDAKKLEEAFQSVAVNGVGALTDGLIDAIEGTKSLGQVFAEVAQGIIRDLLRIMIQKMIVQAIGTAVGAPGVGMSGGGPVGMAFGGFVRGPGTSTSDSIPAVLSNGEFVLNSKAVNNMGVPLLEEINAGNVSRNDFSGAAAKLGFNKKMGPLGGGLIGALMPKKIKSPFSFGLLGSLFGFSAGGLVGASRLGVPNLSAFNRGAPMSAVSNDNITSNYSAPVNIHVNGPMTERQARQTGMQAAAAYKQEIARSSKAGY